MSAVSVRTIAGVLAVHSIIGVDGGTASASHWRCACGESGSIPGGLRSMAAAKGRQHVAEAIAEAVRAS